MHVTHSIIDSCGLAIQTKAGTVIHTADFKIDHTPIDGLTTDLHRFAHYGSKGFYAYYLIVQTHIRVDLPKSEPVVGRTFDNLFSIAKGRVIMSTFSSNTHRLFSNYSEGCSVWEKDSYYLGRSMERNIEITRTLGFVDIDDKHFIEPHEISRYQDSELLILTTGSQGEEMAALSRMATDEHRPYKVEAYRYSYNFAR